jgi:hypothetical protein
MWYGIRMADFLSRRHFVNGGDKQDLEQAIDSLAVAWIPDSFTERHSFLPGGELPP